MAPSSASDHALALHVGGFTPLSLSDWPGQLAAVVFCQGCPWRCRYCHNPHLLPRRAVTSLAWQDVLAFLGRRRGLLDAVVFSGGEPTLQAGIAGAMREVKEMGFRVGLHTAGIYPRRLKALLPLTDWVAMDIKAPFEEYAVTTGARASGNAAFESMQLILASGIDHEFRTTVHPALLTPKSLTTLAHALAKSGVRNYVLQEFRARGCATAELQNDDRSYLVDSFCQPLEPLFSSFSVRHV